MESRFFKQPEKDETLVQRQQEKTRRLNHLHRARFTPERWVRIGEIIGLGVLSLVNFWLILAFFGSVDQSNVFSAPLLPVLIDLITPFVPYAYAVRIWILVLMLFFPLSFYFFVREISGRKLVGFFSTLVVILPISVFLPLRVELGVLAGDGAHIASLTFMPLICLMLLKFLRHGSFWAGIVSSLGAALVALTSPMGFLVLAVFMSVVTFSEMLLGSGRLKFLRFLTVIIFTVGFSAFWYNPKFVILTLQSPQGRLIETTFTNLLPISFFLVPILGIFGFLLFENRTNLQPMFIALFLTFSFGFFSLGAGMAHPSPSRFLPAFGISSAFLLGVALVSCFDFLRLSEKLNKLLIVQYRHWLSFALLGIFFGVSVMVILLYQRELQVEPQVLGFSTEKKIGLWEIRERTSGLEASIGYVISAISLLGVAALKLKLRKQPTAQI